MKSVLLDTHAWAWSLNVDERLSWKARAAIEEADAVFVSPISFFEIGQKVRLGKWPDMEPLVDGLADLLLEQGGRAAALAPETCLSAAMLSWPHRDPFDRILAATAIRLDIPLVSADEVFDGLASKRDGLTRIW